MTINGWWVALALILGPGIVNGIAYNVRYVRAKRLEPIMDHGRKDGMVSGSLGIEPTPKYTGRELAAYREGLMQGKFMVREDGGIDDLRNMIRQAGSIEELERQGMDVSSFKP